MVLLRKYRCCCCNICKFLGIVEYVGEVRGPASLGKEIEDFKCAEVNFLVPEVEIFKQN